MSAPIHSLLADELDLPDAQAKKLLGAMLREVRKRARHRGVRLPELGKFREKNGTLVFEPSDSLARSVNHRFEGLDSEDLGSAPDQPEENDEDSDEGPSTITLGYQDSSNWSPIDAEEEPSESESEGDEPDTAEFEVPSADDAADTEELQASGDPVQESSSQRSTPSEPSASSRDTSSEPASTSQTETEELYPLVEDVPDESDEEDSSSTTASSSSEAEEKYDRERDTLSGIWGEDDESEPDERSSSLESDADSATEPSSFDEMDPFAESEETSEQAPETEYLDQEQPVSEPETSSAPEPEPTDPEEPPTEDSSTEESPSEPSEKKEKSTTLRVLATLLILVLVGGSAWYILGQRGMAPRPGTTFAQLKAQVQPHVQNLPIVGSTDQSEASASSSSPSSATGSASASESDPQSAASSAGTDPASDPAAESTSSSQTSSPPSTTAATTSGSASQQIDPAAGGWTIVVASRTQQGPAQTLVNDFRQRFPDRQLPIDVVPGNVENTTRYRVGVGQFESRDAAQQFLEESGSKLPDGAWPLRLQ